MRLLYQPEKLTSELDRFLLDAKIGKRSTFVFMKKKASTLSPLPSQQATWVFALPEILPEHTRVVLDAHARTAILLRLDEKEPIPSVRSFPLTPSAARIFLALLQAYPQYCPYHTLFTALYPASQGEPSSVWEHTVRPIRRALVALAPVMRAFGLEVVALRGRGYLLAPAARFTGLPNRRQTVS